MYLVERTGKGEGNVSYSEGAALSQENEGSVWVPVKRP